MLEGLRDAHKINDIISIKPENFSKDGLIDLIKQDDMTLRDYFAAKALQGICASGPSSQWSNQMLAREAYQLADAMLAQRESAK